MLIPVVFLSLIFPDPWIPIIFSFPIRILKLLCFGISFNKQPLNSDHFFDQMHIRNFTNNGPFARIFLFYECNQNKCDFFSIFLAMENWSEPWPFSLILNPMESLLFCPKFKKFPQIFKKFLNYFRFLLVAIFIDLVTTATLSLITSPPPALPQGGGDLVLNGNATNKMPELAKPNLAELITGAWGNEHKRWKSEKSDYRGSKLTRFLRNWKIRLKGT